MKNIEEMSRYELIQYSKDLEALCSQYLSEIEKLKGKNPRGAGRKMSDDKWAENFCIFMKCYDSGKTAAEIMKECQISRSTYYRYKKLYEETGVNN